MVIIPNSDIKLIKVPLSIDNSNQLTFENVEAQYNYFNNLPSTELVNATYQRANSIIRFPAAYDDIIHYNYVMYRNESYSNKWFYAYIIGMEYVNDNLTNIQIDTDVFQTWQFDLIFKESFVEREMINVSQDVPRS